MRLVKALRPFFTGTRTFDPADPPVEIDDNLAASLVKSGLAEYTAAMHHEQATDPAPEHAEHAVHPRQAKHGKQS